MGQISATLPDISVPLARIAAVSSNMDNTAIAHGATERQQRMFTEAAPKEDGNITLGYTH